MNFNLKNNIISFSLGLITMCIVMLKCNKCPEIKTKEKVNTVTVTETIIDSTYFKLYNELLNMKPKEVVKRKKKRFKNTSLKNNVTHQENKKDSIRTFITEINDSSETYKIQGEIVNICKGELLSTDFKYNLEWLVQNKTIKDSTIITINNYIVRNKLIIGLETSVKPSLNQLSANLDFLHKKGWMIGYRYERNFNKSANYNESHNLKIAKTIF